jgi:hypothetical protein
MGVYKKKEENYRGKTGFSEMTGSGFWVEDQPLIRAKYWLNVIVY